MNINTTIFMGLSIWIMGFALMLSGWLVDILFDSYGFIPAKVLYKTGAFIVAAPVIYLLWKLSTLLFANRLHIVLFLREAIREAQNLLDAVRTL